MLLVGSALEVVERGEFLLGDDASALKGDALAALDGHLDALRGVWGFGVRDGVRRWVGCRAGAGSDEVTRTSTSSLTGTPGRASGRRGLAGFTTHLSHHGDVVLDLDGARHRLPRVVRALVKRHRQRARGRL